MKKKENKQYKFKISAIESCNSDDYNIGDLSFNSINQEIDIKNQSELEKI